MCKFISVRALFIFITAIIAVTFSDVHLAWAQVDQVQRSPSATDVSVPAMFSYQTMSRSDLAPQAQDQLRAYEQDPTTGAVSFIEFNLDVLRTADAVTMDVNGNAVVLDNVRIEQRGPDDYSFLGSSSEPETGDEIDDAVLVVKGTDVVGTIRTGGQLYRVRPLGDGQVLIRVNQAAFPEEHPPQFEEIERQSRTRELPDLGRIRGEADACDEYKAIIAYTPAAKAQAGNIDALIQLAIDETNQGYVNSQINTRIKLAHAYQTSYVESASMSTDRDRFRIANDGIMDEVHALRDSHAADVGILITKNGNYCGIAAAIGAQADTAFAVVGQNCATGYYSFAHEVGHLQAARHNPQADPTNVPFAYGHGFYHQPGSWRTTMSYNCPGGCTRLNRWSNPNISYGGVATGTAASNDNARVLNETACTVANFRSESATVGPLAFGTIWSSGAKASGTSNWSSSYNSTYGRYEIGINGEAYYYTKYSTAVTPAGDVRFCRTSSVSGKLLVYCYDSNGSPATSRFAFVTYKK